MRFDVSAEAQKLADRINRRNHTQGGRRSGCSTQVVAFLDGAARTFGIDTRSAQYYMENQPHRVVGVYQFGVEAEAIAEDLALFL